MGENVAYIPVESSNVQDFGYDEDEGNLYVRFKPKSTAKSTSPGSCYVYYGVEPEIYQQFLMSPSKGKFVWQYLRDRYEYERLYEF